MKLVGAKISLARKSLLDQINSLNPALRLDETRSYLEEVTQFALYIASKNLPDEISMEDFMEILSENDEINFQKWIDSLVHTFCYFAVMDNHYLQKSLSVDRDFIPYGYDSDKLPEQEKKFFELMSFIAQESNLEKDYFLNIENSLTEKLPQIAQKRIYKDDLSPPSISQVAYFENLVAYFEKNPIR